MLLIEKYLFKIPWKVFKFKTQKYLKKCNENAFKNIFSINTVPNYYTIDFLKERKDQIHFQLENSSSKTK